MWDDGNWQIFMKLLLGSYFTVRKFRRGFVYGVLRVVSGEGDSVRRSVLREPAQGKLVRELSVRNDLPKDKGRRGTSVFLTLEKLSMKIVS